MKETINQILVFGSMVFIGSVGTVLLAQDLKLAVALLIGWAMLLWVAVPGMHPNERERELEGILCSIWLYVSWTYVTKQLTTRQKNLWADVIDAEHRRQDKKEGHKGTQLAYTPVERWWKQ